MFAHTDRVHRVAAVVGGWRMPSAAVEDIPDQHRLASLLIKETVSGRVLVDVLFPSLVREEDDGLAEGAAAARLLLRMRHQQCAWLELLDERIAFCLCRLTHGGKADKVACVADLAVRPATFSCCGILMLPQACQVHIAEKPLAVAWHNQFTLGRAWPLRQLAVAANLFRGGSFG